MRIAVCDTSPLNYLILIGQISLLPKLFDQALVPSAVATELLAPGAPEAVREWYSNPPPWVEHRSVRGANERGFPDNLGAGERAAISLAAEIPHCTLLLDDGAARRYAKERSIPVVGTIGLLEFSSREGWCDPIERFRALRNYGFRANEKLYREVLRRLER